MLTLRSFFLAFERRLTQAALTVGCLGLVVAFLVGFYQVIARFILFSPTPWAEPLIQFSVIWVTYIALAAVMRSGSLIAVDLAIHLSTGRFRTILRLFASISIFALLAILVWYGSVLAWQLRFQRLAGLNISISWAYLALPVGSLVSIFAVIARMLDPSDDAADADPLRSIAD